MKARSVAIFYVLIGLMSFQVSCGPKISYADGEYYCPMHCEGDKSYSVMGDCPICNMSLKLSGTDEKVAYSDNEKIPDNSIFNLTSKWRNQDNEELELKDLKGDILVITMIYTTCKAACPRLVADLRNIETDVNDKSIQYILISIDPETDTPKQLKAFAEENLLDADQWTLLNGSLDDVREFSNVLAVKYKKISPMDFSHSNIITLFDKAGVLVYQQEGLGVDNKKMVSEIQELGQLGL